MSSSLMIHVFRETNGLKLLQHSCGGQWLLKNSIAMRLTSEEIKPSAAEPHQSPWCVTQERRCYEG